MGWASFHVMLTGIFIIAVPQAVLAQWMFGLLLQDTGDETNN
jgi:hypothetical protein